MTSNDNKIHKLEAVQAGRPGDGKSGSQATAMATTSRDMSKVAVIVSLLVVILLIIFFFGMNRNIAGLTDEVRNLGELRNQVGDLDQRMVKMEQELPVQVKRMIALDMVNEMAMKAAYLGNTLDGEASRDKMQTILQSLKEVRQELEQ